MGGPTSSIRDRQHSSWDHVTTQAPPLRQSRDTFGGRYHVYITNFNYLHCCFYKTIPVMGLDKYIVNLKSQFSLDNFYVFPFTFCTVFSA
jgi:hypothetical protein